MICLAASHLRKCYHSLETNPVYLVSTLFSPCDFIWVASAVEVYQKPDESVAPNVYQVTAVLDLTGDGKLAVIVHSFYYEGGQTTIYRCDLDKIEARTFCRMRSLRDTNSMCQNTRVLL
jgi:hypothetical protein